MYIAELFHWKIPPKNRKALIWKLRDFLWVLGFPMPLKTV
jgi:hypothetical protein